MLVVTGATSGGVASAQPFVNGTSYSSASFSNPASFLMSNMNLGNWDGESTTRTFNGGVSEVVLLSSSAAQTTRQQIEGYLAHRWWGAGPSNPLPVAHPYKNAAP
jgi:hypothetical protein